MKSQETVFQERGWAPGRPGGFRETQREKGVWNWEGGPQSKSLGLELSLVHSQEGTKVLQKVPPLKVNTGSSSEMGK